MRGNENSVSDENSIGSSSQLPSVDVMKCREWFKDAVDARERWTKEAIEDYEFVAGKQWTDVDAAQMDKDKKARITINKIKPLITVLSGYQRQNRYDIEFLPRTSDDAPFAELRKGMTKFVMDNTDYERQESQVFLDGSVSGLGWFEVGYKYDEEYGDGEVLIERESPFNIYVDPEARKQFFVDAKFIIRAKWVDKEELNSIYPEHAEEINLQTEIYDKDESSAVSSARASDIFYRRDAKKLRLCECWYKTRERVSHAVMQDGSRIKQSEVSPEMLMSGMVAEFIEVPTTKVRVCIFFDGVELENMASPYEHGEFPFVPYPVFHYMEGDVPSGFVRDLKDPQREINKRRSQNIRILDTSTNAGWLAEEGAMSAEQESMLKKVGAIPGIIVKFAADALSRGKVQRIEPPNPAAALIQAGQQAEADLPAISGINEALMGTDIPREASGRAIELRQRQAVTHVAVAFDNLRWAKKQIAYLLWGRKGKKGIVPQFYTEQKAYRIVGENGQYKDIVINQQKVVQDPATKMRINVTLDDISQGDFDIVIADTQATTTQRMAQFWSLTDAVSKLGLPADMIFDILIDLSDLPKKEEIKQRFAQRQQQQQQAEQQKEAARKEDRLNQTINFKDAPLPVQLAMAAKAGYAPPDLTQFVWQKVIELYAPEYMAIKQQQAAQGQQAQQIRSAMPNAPPPMQQQPPRPQTMTQSAMQSLMAGQTPAM